jgi:hypothetical protein
MSYASYHLPPVPAALTANELSEWARYGIKTMIYIKPVDVDHKVYHALYAADGTQLILVESRAVAEATIREHSLQALSVH